MTKKMIFPGLLGLLLWFGCAKDADNVRLNIRMTDGPGDFQQVNVDIQEIRIKMKDTLDNWQSIPTNPGIYNLLDFQNGIDTLLATGMVPSASLKEVRFILGPNNSIMVDSVVYALSTPSAEESGLKIKINKDLNAAINTLVLDFDAALSIKQNGNGTYILKPVIKLK